ncbi:hypothetical protein BUALT_Bualt16G0060000 [Buddleja alternifolia]|uniref:Fcf2 pre-rRNA processing C-terminal domain-containing protein n=1 Tax=Buddleja alternifolia TaxID=168488 RepID=A0AAV6WK22_9LAMI|nr:hypothetical protein BUALT_Bualt16G0060000 [Buddleja alternifolia]
MIFPWQQDNKSMIGFSWQPNLPSFSSTKNENSFSNEAETSALYKPNSQLIDGIFVPPNDPRKLNKLLNKQVKDTAAKNWFDMPAQTITPELKKDLQLLNVRKRKVREIEDVNRPGGMDKWKISKSRKHGKAGMRNGKKRRH